MNEPLPPFYPEALLEHRDFLRSLARGLLADEHGVEDVLQETWIAALTRPPLSPDSLRAWLARVVRNLALNRRRGERRRAAREREVARPEAEVACEDAALRLAAQRRIVDAVLALREPYRTVIFLRWCEGQPPREIARRLASPIETVRSQLKRGLVELRARLDAEFGDRDAWVAALLPIAGWRRLRPTATALSAGAAAGVAALAVVGAIVVPFAGERMPSPRSVGFARDLQARGMAISPSRDEARELTRPGALTRSSVGPGPAETPLVPPPATVLHGQAVDVRGSPVPDLTVLLELPDGSTETLVTDARGSFSSTSPARTGAHGVRFEDGVEGRAVAASPEAWPSGVAVARFVVEIGPTYRLDLEIPAGVELSDVNFALEAPGSEAAGGVDEVVARDGTRPWVRFPRSPAISLTNASGRSMYALRATSRDGLWRADARVHASSGEYPEPVPVRLESCAAAGGRVSDSLDQPIAGARISIAPAGGGPGRSTISDSTGSWSLGGLLAGDSLLRVRSPAHRAFDLGLRLAAGARESREARLETIATSSLSGVLTSRTGAHEPVGFLRLRSLSDPDSVFTAKARRESAGGRLELAFTFGAVPHGEYELIPPMGDGWAWSPPSLRVAVPGGEARFDCRDDVRAHAIAFRVFDASTGARIERFQAAVLVDRNGVGRREAAARDPEFRVRSARFDEPVSPAVPGGMDAWWLVEHEGHRSALGEVGEAREENGRLVVELRLEPSWRCNLWIGTRDEAGRPMALRGARVATTGGKTLATSLGDGGIQLELVYDPGRLEIALDGWQVKRWEGFWRGRPRTPLDVHHVWMEREDR